MSSVPGELIESARQGDALALERLLALCQPDLQRYARRTCATQDIEDAVQDALIILYRRLGGLRALSAFSGWVFRIVKHECLRRLKSRQEHCQLNEVLASGGSSVDLDLRLDLVRSIRALPPLYRDVLVLRDVTELSAEETAQKVGASVQAVKSRLHRARYLVREQLS